MNPKRLLALAPLVNALPFTGGLQHRRLGDVPMTYTPIAGRDISTLGNPATGTGSPAPDGPFNVFANSNSLQQGGTFYTTLPSNADGCGTCGVEAPSVDTTGPCALEIGVKSTKFPDITKLCVQADGNAAVVVCEDTQSVLGSDGTLTVGDDVNCTVGLPPPNWTTPAYPAVYINSGENGIAAGYIPGAPPTNSTQNPVPQSSQTQWQQAAPTNTQKSGAGKAGPFGLKAARSLASAVSDSLSMHVPERVRDLARSR